MSWCLEGHLMGIISMEVVLAHANFGFELGFDLGNPPAGSALVLDCSIRNFARAIDYRSLESRITPNAEQVSKTVSRHAVVANASEAN